MLTVKLISKSGIDTQPLPGGAPEWGPVRFALDPQTRDYDWLVVVDDLPFNVNHKLRLGAEPLACSRERAVLLTYEPSSVKLYSAGYLAQFGIVLTSQEPGMLAHRHRVSMPPMGSWYYRRTHDALRAAPVPPVKSRTISTLCSAKQMRHTLHNLRFNFTRRLQAALPELDVYGHGINPIADKADAIDPYRYHIAIENHIAPDHWTEKLADAWLGCALPIYAGCPNVTDYFPPESFIPVDIMDFDATLSTIRRIINSGEYEKRLPAILEARRRLLEEHNLFAMLARFVTDHHGDRAHGQAGGTLYSRRMVLMRNIPGAVQYLWKKEATRRQRRKMQQYIMTPRDSGRP